MFYNQKLSFNAKRLSMSDKALQRAAGRMEGYLYKHGLSVQSIIYALDYLIATKEEEEAKIKKLELVYHLQNPKHRKKEQQIIEMFMDGFGAQRISKELKIPKSTIENFIRKNNITRHNDG